MHLEKVFEMSLSFFFLELFVQEHKFGMCFEFLDKIFKSTLDGNLFELEKFNWVDINWFKF